MLRSWSSERLSANCCLTFGEMPSSSSRASSQFTELMRKSRFCPTFSSASLVTNPAHPTTIMREESTLMRGSFVAPFSTEAATVIGTA